MGTRPNPLHAHLAQFGEYVGGITMTNPWRLFRTCRVNIWTKLAPKFPLMPAVDETRCSRKLEIN